MARLTGIAPLDQLNSQAESSPAIQAGLPISGRNSVVKCAGDVTGRCLSVSGNVTRTGYYPLLVVDVLIITIHKEVHMKDSIRPAIVIAVLIPVFAAVSFGANKSDEIWFKGATVDAMERSLAMALRTPSPGMQASASQVIRDLRVLLPSQDFSLLIIPLMAIVKDEEADASVRMVAALALHDLKSGKGDFTIQQLARFTKNERLKHLCTWLSLERKQKNPTGFQTTTVADN